jgi:hypothetical protein
MSRCSISARVGGLRVARRWFHGTGDGVVAGLADVATLSDTTTGEKTWRQRILPTWMQAGGTVGSRSASVRKPGSIAHPSRVFASGSTVARSLQKILKVLVSWLCSRRKLWPPRSV